MISIKTLTWLSKAPTTFSLWTALSRFGYKKAVLFVFSLAICTPRTLADAYAYRFQTLERHPMWEKARVRSLDLEGTAFGDVQATLRLVLAALEVILVTRADDGGVTHGLFEQPVEEALLLTSLRDETRNDLTQFSVSLFSKQFPPRSAALPRSSKNPSNPHSIFSTKCDGSRLAKVRQTRQRNPSISSILVRALDRANDPIHRSIGSGRVARRSWTTSNASRHLRTSSRVSPSVSRRTSAPKRRGPSAIDG